MNYCLLLFFGEMPLPFSVFILLPVIFPVDGVFPLSGRFFDIELSTCSSDKGPL